MRHEEGFFTGVRGARIYHQCWLPDGEPRAALLIVHGLAEHSGRYGNVVQHLVPLGYAAYAPDHLGHGRSEGARVFVERFADYTTTLKTFFDMVRGRQPGKPVFLLGHSLGALIEAAYLLDHQAELAGAVLSGPLVKVPDNISPAVVAASKLLSVVMPKLGVAAVDAADVSQDPAVVQAYIDDPLVYRGKTTARLAAEMLKAMQRVSAEAGHITLPVLLLQGGADRLVNPAGAQMLYDTVGSADKTLHIYDRFCHEVFNEPGCARVLRDVEVWLEAHLP
jgi:alpha-beta hydrolase superfamily lysophospholipase